MKSGHEEQAIPFETEVVEIAARNQNRALLFNANMILAEIYQPLNRLNEARTVLEKAQSLIKPGPADSEIDNKQIVETYGRLADVYKALQIPIKELVSLEKAITVLQVPKDDEHRQQTKLAYLKRTSLKPFRFKSWRQRQRRMEGPQILFGIPKSCWFGTASQQTQAKDENLEPCVEPLSGNHKTTRWRPNSRGIYWNEIGPLIGTREAADP